MSKQNIDWAKEYVGLVLERYGPSLLTAPQTDNPVAHHTDCDYFVSLHCSCGLLAHLSRLNVGPGQVQLEKLYPAFYKEIFQHYHAKEFLEDNRREVERRMASTHSAFLRQAKKENIKKYDRVLHDALAMVREDDLKVSQLFRDIVEMVWFMRTIEEQIENMFFDTKALRNLPDMFGLVGEMKATLWRIYNLIHQRKLEEVGPPAVDLTGEGNPSLIWINAHNNRMLRCYYDLGDNQFWINLSDIYTGKGRSRIFSTDKDFLGMLNDFLGIPSLP